MLMATAIPVNASPILRKVSSPAHRLSPYHIGALSRRYQGIAFSRPSYFDETPTAVRSVLRSRRSTRVSKAAASAPHAFPDLV
jgi:hypothetical protein